MSSPKSSKEEKKIINEIIQNLPEKPKEPLFGNIPAHMFFLVGFFFALLSLGFPQFTPFFILILIFLVIRSYRLLLFATFLFLLALFIPVMEESKWYCEDCTCLKQEESLYKFRIKRNENATQYTKWYTNLVEHKNHRWKLYERNFLNVLKSDIEKIGGEEHLPFPGLEIYSPKPELLQYLRNMPPNEAIQLFINWKELVENADFRHSFKIWKGQTSSFFHWLKQKNSQQYEKVNYLIKSSTKPLPKLNF